MIIPEKNKNVRSFKIPQILFKGIIFIIMTLGILFSILTYDYWRVLSQVYENKHLLIENRQLKEQLQLFQSKLNTITQDLERINIFERKLRAISGLEAIPASNVDVSLSSPGQALPSSSTFSQSIGEPDRDFSPSSLIKIFKPKSLYKTTQKLEKYESESKFKELKTEYEEQISSDYVLETENLNFQKEWSGMTRQSLNMANSYAEFDYKYGIVVDFLKEIETRINELDQHLLNKESFLRSTPTLTPTAGHLTSKYGPRLSPYAGRIKMHEGIDFGAPIGTPIVAPADGIITFSGAKPGFGNFIQIDHGYGVETIYGHAATLAVRKGQKVIRGDKIATVGNTGYSTGPHVHYEVRVNGTPVDPLYYTLN